MEELNADYQQEKLDHARESHFNRDVQRQQMNLRESMTQMQALMVRLSRGARAI